MNFLAHLYLSCNNEDLLLGNFIADFIRNRDVASYPAEVRNGIELHRNIDRYTDNHPEIRKGTRRLQPHHRKYAPVVIDILYDYLLCQNWPRYSDQSLITFAQDTYRTLERRLPEMPAKLQRRLPDMINGDWLVQYGTEEGIRYTLSRMEQRTRFPSNFSAAYDHLMKDYELYNEEFNRFFPEVIEYVRTHHQCS